MISMNIIYVDILFLVNFICDYILLLCTARISGAVIRRIPIIISASLGGLYACISYIPTLSWLGHPLMKCGCSLLLCIISFGKEKQLLRCTILFLAISAMAGGLLSAISIPYGNLSFIPLHTKTLLIAFLTLYYVLTRFLRNSPKLCTRNFHDVSVSLNERRVNFRALRDSGNELYDPITNRPVLVCSTSILNELLPNPPNWDADIYELFYQLNTSESLTNRIYLIPCRTVTGSGILLGIKPDELIIDGRTEPHIIAATQTKFSAESSYQAIY